MFNNNVHKDEERAISPPAFKMPKTYVPGQLVFYKPAPTIRSLPKCSHPLRAGIFLDYYVFPDDKFSQHYTVVDLEDFRFTNLHPIFPMLARFLAV